MTTPTIPPAVPPTPPAGGTPQTPGTPPRSGGAGRVIAILTIALGGAVVLGTIGSAVFSTVAAASVRTEDQSLDVTGVRELDVQVDAATLRVEFAAVPEASLEVTSGTGIDPWTFERDGDELHIATPDRFRSWWLFGGEVSATLTLPQELQGANLDAQLDLSAGDLVVEGEFGEIDIEVGAGTLTVDGSARTLSMDLSAGGADLDLADVNAAEFSVSAGAVQSRLTGSAPSSVTVDVSAGAIDLTLPEASYEVRSDVSAGEFDNRLTSGGTTDGTVDVTVSAGSATIRSAR